ncbi:hypothetical protein [Escherichia coli]|uniref:hypothetical protein n=1 Tax=Escherichia coli TaxID=562 RepID=UPI003F52E4B1
MGFSYADLEKEIGIRKASIHHHFPRKTDGCRIAWHKYRTFPLFQHNQQMHQDMS